MKRRNRAAWIIKTLASIGIFAGIVVGGLGTAIHWHLVSIMEGGRVHAVVTDIGKIHTEVEEVREEKKRRHGERRRYDISYRIIWYQDIGIQSQDTDVARISLDFDEKRISHQPSQEDLVSDLPGFEKGQELDIYIRNDGKAFPAERIEGNAEIAVNLIYAGATAFMVGAVAWGSILGIGFIRRKNTGMQRD